MAFWDWLVNPMGAGRTSGNPNPAGTFAGGPAGSYGGGGSDSFDTILNQIRAYNDRKNGTGGFRSNPNAQRSLSGGPRYGDRNLGGQIGSGLRSSGPPGIDDILARLEQLQDPGQYMMGEGDIDSQAMAAASAQYDPLIAALKRQEGAATSRANQGKVELGQMFNALSGSLQGDIPKINQQYAGDKKETLNLYKDQQKAVQDQYKASQAEQEATMQRLGTQAAAGDVLPQQQRDNAYFKNMASQENVTQQNALTQEQQGAVTYTREGSQIARTEGVQRGADLMAELQSLLAEYEGKIGDYGAAKQQAYISGKGQLQSQMMQDANDRADRASQNYLDMINLGRALKKDEAGEAGGGYATTTKSPGDVASRVLGMGLNQAQAQGIQDVFMSAVGSDPTILSGRDSVFGQSVPKEALAQRVVALGKQRHFSPAALNALQTIALEYFGRR